MALLFAISKNYLRGYSGDGQINGSPNGTIPGKNWHLYAYKFQGIGRKPLGMLT
jgi:hypothetical protein